MQRVLTKMTPILRTHILKIGEIVWAWNCAHGAIFIAFSGVLGSESIAKALWDQGASDTQQRSIVRAYISALPKNDFLGELKWILDNIDQLSQFRNSFVHTNVLHFGKKDSFKDGFASRSKYMEKLTQIEDSKLFVPLRNDIVKLEHYIYYIVALNFPTDLRDGLNGPMKNRPTLDVI